MKVELGKMTMVVLILEDKLSAKCAVPEQSSNVRAKCRNLYFHETSMLLANNVNQSANDYMKDHICELRRKI